MRLNSGRQLSFPVNAQQVDAPSGVKNAPNSSATISTSSVIASMRARRRRCRSARSRIFSFVNVDEGAATSSLGFISKSGTG